MRNFEYNCPTKIIFGKNAESELLYELRKYGDRVLLVYGGQSIKRSGLFESVTMQLREANKAVFELSGVLPNPRLSLVEKGIDIVKRNGVDLILAVGGGSVIDTAKAIAFGAKTDDPVWDYFENDRTPHKAIPVGVVLTFSASGSEASNSCVITNDLTNVKRGVHGDCFIPRFAILNPERTFTLNKYQTACGCTDILAHLFERYFSLDEGCELTSNLLIAVMKTVIKYTPVALARPNDYNARAEIMYAGTIAHNDSLSVGRRADFATHKIEHAVSAYNDLAHGEGLAIIFPAWMKYVYEVKPSMFARLAVELFGIEKGDKLDEQLTYEFISKLEEFYKSIGLKTKLREVGIDANNVKFLAELAVYKSTTIGNFKKLNVNDVMNILKMAL